MPRIEKSCSKLYDNNGTKTDKLIMDTLRVEV